MKTKKKLDKLSIQVELLERAGRGRGLIRAGESSAYTSQLKLLQRKRYITKPGNFKRGRITWLGVEYLEGTLRRATPVIRRWAIVDLDTGETYSSPEILTLQNLEKTSTMEVLRALVVNHG